MMMNNNSEYKNLKLVYVEKAGTTYSGEFEYDFFFSEVPETVYGEDWGETCPAACGNLRPDISMYSKIFRLNTSIPLMCAQENVCFSMADCTDHIISICFEIIDGYEIYPEPYRLVFEFGEDFQSVVDKLSGRECYFSDFSQENLYQDNENEDNNDDFFDNIN